MKFSNLTATWARWLRGGGVHRSRLYGLLFSYINLLPTDHHMVDWWSAPVATHHTHKEMVDWFTEIDFEVLRTNPLTDDLIAEQSRKHGHAAITVLGKRTADN